MSTDFTADLAVVIGINDYAGAVGRLETPVRDARAIAEALESRFGYEVVLLLDGDASKKGIVDLLEELTHRVTKGSRLLFYFAGHGIAQDSDAIEGPRGYLVPHGATAEVSTHLSMEAVHQALVSLLCRHLLVVLDCCFSGSFHWEGRRPMHLPGALLYEERYRYWILHPAHWALASAAHDQYSLDIPDRRRGQEGFYSPFAAAFLDGLAGEADRYPEGGDGVVTLPELYAYVRERLAPHQTPVLGPLKGQTRGEFVFRDPRRPLALQSAQIAVALKPELNPYRGLEPYRFEDASTYFGRGEAAHLLRDWVVAHPWSVVVGPSGSGKSSLVQAGLLPALRDDPAASWVTPPPLRVAGDPCSTLRDALTAIASPSPAAGDLRDPGQVMAWAGSWAVDHPAQHLLLVVDQAEELVTRVARGSAAKGPESLPEGSARFLSCLAALIRGGGGRIRVVVTVRSDYETDLDDGPWSSLWKDGRFIVPPLRREDLREIIEGPAAARALYFDDPRLVDRLVDEVWGMPGGLPLLSYALSRLFLAYLDSSRGDRLFTAEDVAAIGGEPGKGGEAVAPGAIVRILRDGADKAVQALPDDEHRKTLWRVLLRMVHLVGSRTTRRQVPEEELIYPTDAENLRIAKVCGQFDTEARLLVSSKEDGRDLIEPAHDELLVAWPELVRRIDEARVVLPVHRRLTEAAMAWAAPPAATASRERQPKRDLDLKLLGLVETSGLPEKWLNKAEADYVAAARRARRLRTVLRWAAAVVIVLVSTGAALFFRFQSQRSDRLRYQTIIQSLTNQAEADLGGDLGLRGLLLTRQAYGFLPQSRGELANPIDQLVRRVLDPFFPPRDKDQESRIDELFRRALDDLPPSRAVLQGALGDPKPMAFHPGGQLLAAGRDGKLGVLILPKGGIVPAEDFSPLAGVPSDEELVKIAFSTDGRFLVAGFSRGSLCIWRLAGTPPIPLRESAICTRPEAGHGTLTALAFRPGVPDFVAGWEDSNRARYLQVWAVTEDQSGLLWLEPRSIRRVQVAILQPPETASPVTVDHGGKLRRMVAGRKTEGTVIGSACSGEATEVAVSPGGGRVAVSCDVTLRLWDLRPFPGGWSHGVGRSRPPLAGSPTALAARPGTSFPLTVGLANGDVVLYPPENGAQAPVKWKRPPGQGSPDRTPDVRALLWSSGGAYHVIGNDGVWWRAGQKNAPSPRQVGSPVCAAAGSSDGSWVAVLVDRPLAPALLKIWPASGEGDPVLLPSQTREGYLCDPGLAFHPTRAELAVGQETQVILWSLAADGRWQPRHLAETDARIYALAWSGDLLAIGGRRLEGNASVSLVTSTGELKHRWTLPDEPVTRLAFAPGGRRLVAGLSDGTLRIWDVERPEAPPVELRQPGKKVDSFAFLDPDRLSALSGQEVWVWNLGTARLADAACRTLTSNLAWSEWTTYVDPDLSRYAPACPELGPDPFLLSHADLLAEAGGGEEAQRIYRRLNELLPGTVVDPARRAYAEGLEGKLYSFKGTDRKDVLSAMAQAREYEVLRQAEKLPPLSEGIQLLLCRRGALLGEPQQSLPFCNSAVTSFRRNAGMAHDSRGLARALLGDLRGAREDFLVSRDWQDDPSWRARRQEWIDLLSDHQNPITPEVLQEISREERGMTVDNVARPGGRYYYTSLSLGARKIGFGEGTPGPGSG